MSSSFVIEMLPNPSSEAALLDQAMRLKKVRLRALSINPETFISRYEDEVDQKDEFWLERVRPAHVDHWVASVRRSAGTEEDNGAFNESTEWCGVLVVIKRENEEEQERRSVYWLAAMWVEPEMRGQGVGSGLVRAALEKAKQTSRDQGHTSVRFDIEAVETNRRAIELYQRLGFTTIDTKYEYTGTNGVVGIEYKMEMEVDLSHTST